MDAGSGFQTSFVVAALIAVLFLAPRLGGDEEIHKRGVQVAIAFSLFLLVLASTSSFIRPPDAPTSSISFDSSGSGDEGDEYLTDAANKASARGTVHLAAGILLVIAGVAMLKRHPVLPSGFLFGGVLLLLLGGPPALNSNDPLSSYYSFVLGTFGKAEIEWDIVRLMVLAIGTILLVSYAQMHWQEPPDEPSTDGEEPPAEDSLALAPE